LLVHRSGLGLGAGDLLWWPPSTYDRPEIARRLRFIKPATSFRSAFAYDNVLYLVAGQVIEAVSGKSWEQFVTERILQPLGMTSTVVLHSAAGDSSGDVAGTHARVDGTVRPIVPFLSDNTNPAGGINSGAEDMAKWLIAQLDSGRVGTGRLWSQRTTALQWSLVTPMDPGSPPPELAPARRSFYGYALGFFVSDYRGQKLVSHTGGLPGYVSRVALLPDRKTGVAILTNAESGAAFDVLTLTVLDYYLGAPKYDWLANYARLTARSDSASAVAGQQTAAARDTTSRPSLSLEGYDGHYEDAWYGGVTVGLEDGHLVMRFGHSPSLIGDLEHWQYDTFIVKWRDRELRADAFATFALGPDGKVEHLAMKPASDEVDFSFDFQDLDLRPVPDSAATGSR
jgi:CubicO group peptidase (beta-lactamase class C family)